MAREQRFGPEGIFVDDATPAPADAGGDDDEDDDSGDDEDDSGDDEDDSGDDEDADAGDASPDDDASDDSSDASSAARGDAGFDPEKLRNYELRKLRRYFAVAAFDRPSTASAVYAAGDGVEIEATSVPLVLSFIPEDQAFDAARLRDAATSSEAYVPPKAYCCAARQQTKVTRATERHRKLGAGKGRFLIIFAAAPRRGRGGSGGRRRSGGAVLL